MTPAIRLPIRRFWSNRQRFRALAGEFGTRLVLPPVNSGTPAASITTRAARTLAVSTPFPARLRPFWATRTRFAKRRQSYLRTAPTRNFLPTERISFQSKYFKRLEMSGSASYNSSNNNIANLYDADQRMGEPARRRQGRSARHHLRSGKRKASCCARELVRDCYVDPESPDSSIPLITTTGAPSGVFNQVIHGPVRHASPDRWARLGILLPISQFAALGCQRTNICQHLPGSALQRHPAARSTAPLRSLISTTLSIKTSWARSGYRIPFNSKLTSRSALAAELAISTNAEANLRNALELTLLFKHVRNPNMGATYYPGGGGTAGACRQAGATGNYYLRGSRCVRSPQWREAASRRVAPIIPQTVPLPIRLLLWGARIPLSTARTEP